MRWICRRAAGWVRGCGGGFTRPLPDWVELGEVWPLGDSPPVLVTALTEKSSSFTAA